MKQKRLSIYGIWFLLYLFASSAVLLAENVIVLKTKKKTGDKISINASFTGEVQCTELEGSFVSGKAVVFTLKASEIRLQGEIQELTVNDAEIFDINTSQCPSLIYLSVDKNELETLSFTGNNQLEELSCKTNKLKSLDIRNLPNLMVLNCSENNLTQLDLSKNPKMSRLYCISNKLKTIDIKKLVDLKELALSQNELEAIDLSANYRLWKCFLFENKLSGIDVTKNRMLNHLSVADNKIKVVNTSNNRELWTLFVQGNEIENLDLKNNLELEQLYCGKNKIKHLDLSWQKKIMQLSVSENPLTELLLNNENKLKLVWLYGTFLPNKVLKGIIGNLPDYTSKPKSGKIFIRKEQVLDGIRCFGEDIAAAHKKNWDLVYLLKDNQMQVFGNEDSYRELGVQLTRKDNSKDWIFSVELSNPQEYTWVDWNNDGVTSKDEIYMPSSTLSVLEEVIKQKNDLLSVTIYGNIKYLRARDNNLNSVVLKHAPDLERLDISQNKLTELDLKSNLKLSSVDCSLNSIPLKNMKQLAMDICDRTKEKEAGSIVLMDSHNSSQKEQNEIEKAIVSALQKKNWKAFDAREELYVANTIIETNKIVAYPNPTSDFLYFSSLEVSEALVCTLGGKCVAILPILDNQRIDLRGIAEGTYILKIGVNKMLITIKR